PADRHHVRRAHSLGHLGGLEVDPAGCGVSHRHHHRARRCAVLLFPHHLECEAVMVTIRLDGVGAYYGKALRLTEVTTPAFSGGEVIAVIGPNAAGKSTLFKRMAGLLKGPGRVIVEGSRKGPRAISYMPQDTAANAV